MKEKWNMWVPLKKICQKRKVRNALKHRRQRRIIFLVFILFASFSDLRKSDRRNSSGKERKVLYATRATRGYQKHWISPRIQVKFRKIQIFSFSQIYGILVVRIFEPRIKVTLRDESYAWVPKSRDFVGFPREIVNTYKIVNTYEYI